MLSQYSPAFGNHGHRVVATWPWCTAHSETSSAFPVLLRTLLSLSLSSDLWVRRKETLRVTRISSLSSRCGFRELDRN